MTSVILKAGQYREPDAPAAETLLQPLEGRSGYVFGFWQIKPPKETDEAFSNVLQDHLLRLAAGFGVGANAQHRFEQFLRALNEGLAAQVRDGAWSIPIQNVHAFVGVACDGQVYFSGMGDLSALYMHRRPNGQYQVYNLFRGIQTEQSLPSWEKPFAVVLDGDLQPGDVLCVSNHDLQRQLPGDDLNHYLSTLPPGSAAEKIRQQFPARTDLSLLILQVHDASPFMFGRATPHTDLSVAQMVETEGETERLLEDQAPNVFGALRERFSHREGQTTAGTARPFMVHLISTTKSIARFIGSAFRWISGASRQLAKVRSVKDLGHALGTQAGSLKERILGRFERIPRSSRYLLGAAAILLVVFIIGISVISKSQAKAKILAAYNAQVATIEERRDQAAAALIYRDEQKARALYGEAQRLLDQLPKDTPDRVTKATTLASDITAGLDQVRHVVNIPEPPLKADLAVIGNITGTALLNDNGTLYVFGNDKRVYRYDAPSKVFVLLATTNGDVGTARSASTEDGTSLFLDDRPGISRFDATHLTQQVTDVKPGTGNWADLEVYGKKLYVLSPSNGDGQILRFAETASGFGPPSNWIKAKSTSLTDATSLSIDGTAYVLKKNGTIVRFSAGNEMGWAVEKADPPITDARRIWTDQKSDYVYVLEPAAKRLVVYAKQTGSFIAQYRSDAFAALTDFSVDEKNKLIYFLSGSKLFGITASHLK